MYWKEFEDTFQSRCNFFFVHSKCSQIEREKVLKFIFNFFLYHLVVKEKERYKFFLWSNLLEKGVQGVSSLRPVLAWIFR